MTHIEYWIANDGMKFKNEDECVLYELKQDLSHTTIRVLTQNGTRYSGPFVMNESVYNKSESVIIPDEGALEDMKRIQDYTGFYPDINAIGDWIYINDRWELVTKERRINYENEKIID